MKRFLAPLEMTGIAPLDLIQKNERDKIPLHPPFLKEGRGDFM
jgi:hypothetical protein